MKVFKIIDLIPQEEPRMSTLEFLADLYRRERSLDSIMPQPLVESIENRLYLSDGTQRAIFYWLNEIYIIRANETILDEACREEINEIEAIDKRLRDKRLYTFRDLVQRIENPERFIVRI